MMSVFDSHLELEILLDDLVDGFVKKGKSFDWIQETISEGISYAIQDYKSDNGIDED
jgi:hypothetical protein